MIATMTGILRVLMSGIPWEHLPRGPDCGNGMTHRPGPTTECKLSVTARPGGTPVTAARAIRSSGITLASTLPACPLLRVASIGAEMPPIVADSATACIALALTLYHS